MAVHYPTDYYLFTPILSNDEACVIKDKSLRNYCQSKVPWFDWDKGGSRELDLTLSSLRELEQIIGQKIDWYAEETYDDLIKRKSTIPNKYLRLCTQDLKILPAFRFCYKIAPYWLSHIGIRADEPKRVEKWTCKNDSIVDVVYCDIKGQYRGRKRRKKIEWRTSHFPLWENGITKADVASYWDKKGVEFPAVSNCDFCFFQRKKDFNYQKSHYPERLQWWVEQEKKTGRKWRLDRDLEGYSTEEENKENTDGEVGGCYCSG